MKPTDQMMIDRLADAARMGKISRRSFMHYATAAGMTATTATGLWTTSAAGASSAAMCRGVRCSQH